MCDSFRPDLASRSLLLCPVWEAIRRRRVPRKERESLLPVRNCVPFNVQERFIYLKLSLQNSNPDCDFFITGILNSVEFRIAHNFILALVLYMSRFMMVILTLYTVSHSAMNCKQLIFVMSYCRQDFLEMFAPRCGGCGHPILDNYISALSRHWHPECFVCRVSDKIFEFTATYICIECYWFMYICT